MRDRLNIADSIIILKSNLENTARVAEWAELMGYSNPKRFARKFLRHFSVRPQTCLKCIRLESILTSLRNDNTSNFEIARKYGIPDEIALNKYINYHLHCSPSQVKCMPEKQLQEKVEKLGSKVR